MNLIIISLFRHNIIDPPLSLLTPTYHNNQLHASMDKPNVNKSQNLPSPLAALLSSSYLVYLPRHLTSRCEKGRKGEVVGDPPRRSS